MNAVRPVGDLLREWRQRRRLSQLDLACDADISARHLSFLETGRSQPSRDMLLHLAEHLEVPPRERNLLLTAAGFAPMFPERRLDDPALGVARQAIDIVLDRQKPYPAFALDRHWNIVASNSALPQLYEGVAPDLLARPVNAGRLSLHPEGLAPRIVNLVEWRAHLLERLRHEIEITADLVLIGLMRELEGYPVPYAGPGVRRKPDPAAVLIPLTITTSAGTFSFVSTTTIFGTPIDVTLSELAVELFFPADQATDALVRRLAAKERAAAE